MVLDLRLVDAFTDRPFAGNPAAVAIMAAFPPEPLMQAVAAELNLPETAFVVARHDGAFDLRWFTPTVEVDLCGHATLAAAHVLGGDAGFHTRSGLLECRRAEGGIELAFPADRARPAPAPEVGVDGVVGYGVGRHFALVECAAAGLVRDLVPDLARLAAIGSMGVIVTAPGDRPGVDMVSRVFCPNAGIPEDPVTGSAHCLLAEWWGERLGRAELVGEQASRRGGTVRMRRDGSTVVLGGSAVTVGSIHLAVEAGPPPAPPGGGSGAQVEV
ncbi:MAG: PhzF family phenazine biosynthesis protein [Actinomycetota bacterium]|nr:PhzF family phenazine biosynthesis protein [Actinomycetota bacterium]